MSENQGKINVLFLCTGNSCRSQIAEGWAKHLKADIIDAQSAGVAPGAINTGAIEVMAEAGVDISPQTPKHVDKLVGIDFDYVVTLCEDAREHCPVFGGEAKLIHRAFEDPTFSPGSEEEIMAAFRKLRDEMRAFVEKMPESLEKPNQGTCEQKE